MASDHIGEQFGSYRLEKLIGTGGFATVYLGVHTLLGSKAAIKLLHTHLAGNEIQEFGEEARMIASLEHPHIVQVKDFAAQDGIPYLVLDYAPYGSLRSLHAQEGPFSLLQSLQAQMIIQYKSGMLVMASYSQSWRAMGCSITAILRMSTRSPGRPIARTWQQPRMMPQ